MKKSNMKKFLLLFCVLACVFSLTACTNSISSAEAKTSQKQQELDMVQSNLVDWTMDTITFLDAATEDQIMAFAESATDLSAVTGNIYYVNPNGINTATIEFYNSWNKTREDLGKLKTLNRNDVEVTVSDETGVLASITVKATFEKRTCTFEMVVDSDLALSSGAINPTYTFGEKAEKALLNTLLGMGTVFVVLVFISFVISLLKHVNKIGKKPEAAKEAAQAASQGVDNAIAQIVSNEENEMDDLELVAVITAAIAASEGTSADGLVVRSIKKVNNWRR